MRKHIIRRAAVSVAVLLLCATVTAAAQTTFGTTGTVGTTFGTETTDTTQTSTTTEATTTTTTAKPTDPHVDSVSYVSESMELPKGAVLHGRAVTADGRGGKKALVFDGNTNYIEVDIKKMSSPFTLSMWINWQGNPAEDTVGQRVFSFLQAGTENNLSFTPLLRQSDPSGQINGMVLFATCYKEQWLRNDLYYPSDVVVSDMLSNETWHHLALTVNGDNITMYIDGVQWRADTLPFTFEDLKADTLLIGSAVNASCLFKGQMQDVHLYAGALTPQQIGRIAQDADPFDATVTVTPQVYTHTPAQGVVYTTQVYSAKTLLENGDQLNTVVRQNDTVFWETPFLNGGQTITGSLVMDNLSKHLVDLRLDTIALPQAGSPEWEYLSDINVTVSIGSNVLYSGPYTSLTPAALQMDFKGMSYGRQYIYTVTLSRPLTATTPPLAVSVPWQFVCDVQPTANNALPESKPLTALLILLPISAALLGFSLFFAITRKQTPVFTVWDTVVAWCKDRLLGPLTEKVKTFKPFPPKDKDRDD